MGFKVKARFLHFGKVNFFLLSERQNEGRRVGFITKRNTFCVVFLLDKVEAKEAFRIGTWLRLFMALSLENPQ